MKYAEIILDIKNKNVDKVFHYVIPYHIKEKIKIGMRAFVPFGQGNYIREGYIIGFVDNTDIDISLIKEIKSLPDDYALFDENMIYIAKFMKEKYYCTLSETLQCIMPKIMKEKIDKYININYKLENIEQIVKEIILKNNVQSKVLSLLKKSDNLTVNEITKLLGISKSPINTLEKNGILTITEKVINKNDINLDLYKKTDKLVLNEDQQKAYNFINFKIEQNSDKPILLYGVTGSGKTEVYIRIIEDILKKGKQAIFLVPEISLTPQTVERVVGRFGNRVSVTHSKLSDGERFSQWQRAKNGEIDVIVGARSAIFTPFKNLGVIVIDEEHESTYKSETTPKYDVREVAKKLCKINKCHLILGSATPSVETYFEVNNGNYDLVTMPNRVNNSMLDIKIVDMREELENGNRSIFSKELFYSIKNNLEKKEQTILFLNRRGHSNFISCRKCGYVMECENCNISYTYHLSDNRVICHYCGSTKNIPNICPSCQSKYIKYFGIGTQKVEEQLKKYFQNAKILRMDADTVRKKNTHKNILEKFKNQEADILIGTQMIAKGLDFPNVSLVGVISADILLNIGDYKSSEKTFQLIMQVSGRAGRAEKKGKVLIQTYTPEHYSIQFVKENNYLDFYRKEIKERRENDYPPFCNIFFIMISGEEEEKVLRNIKFLSNVMEHYNKRTKFFISEPVKAYIYKLNKQYRYKIMLKAKDEVRLKNFVMYCVDILKEKMDTKNQHIILSLNPNNIQ